MKSVPDNWNLLSAANIAYRDIESEFDRPRHEQEIKVKFEKAVHGTIQTVVTPLRVILREGGGSSARQRFESEIPR